MKSLFFLGLLLLTSLYVKAQTKAVTETGDEVVLFADGTWKYLDDDLIELREIPVNEKQFVKDENSSFLVKSTVLDIGIWISPKKWKFEKANQDEVSEFQFLLKGEDLYAMLISEKVEIPIETLKIVALENARTVAPDIKVIEEEYRNVNGVKLLMLQMSGTIQGMKVTYRGYYYSNEKGTIQLLTYTASNLFTDYLKDINNFLNGFVVL